MIVFSRALLVEYVIEAMLLVVSTKHNFQLYIATPRVLSQPLFTEISNAALRRVGRVTDAVRLMRKLCGQTVSKCIKHYDKLARNALGSRVSEWEGMLTIATYVTLLNLRL